MNTVRLPRPPIPESESLFRLVPKTMDESGAYKTTGDSSSPYSCLISILADDDADYNYLNQSFWVHFPTDVEEQLRKFGENTWLESRQEEMQSKQTAVEEIGTASGEWVCTDEYIINICQFNSDTNTYYNCMKLGPFCAEYTYIEEEGPGGGGGGGEPGDDPGECDPQGIEPCYDGPGGSQPPSPDPDPCDDDPELHCFEPCDTGEAVLDDIDVQQEVAQIWLDSFGPKHNPYDHDQRNEAMSMVTVTSSGYEVTEIPPGSSTSSCHFDTPQNSILSNTVAIIHTHPYGNGDIVNDAARGCSGEYIASNVSDGDEAMMMQQIVAQLGLVMYIKDKDNIRIIESSNPLNYNQTIERCGY